MSGIRFNTLRRTAAAFLSAAAVLLSSVPAAAGTNTEKAAETAAEKTAETTVEKNAETAAGASGEFAEQIRVQCEDNFSRYLKTGDPEDLQDPSVCTLPSVRTAGALRSAASARTGLPASFDLRSSGTVTPVKNQMDWNTCWSFGTIAASETSILSDLGRTFAEFPIDLSELQLAWMTLTAPDASKTGLNGQNGEGYVTGSSGSAAVLSSSSNVTAAARAIEAGSGPVTESEVPYKNREGYTAVYGGSDLWYYPADGDWSVPEDYRFRRAYTLSETRVIPADKVSGRNAVKAEIASGHPVDIGCYLRKDDTIYYNPDTAASFCSRAISNHEVCIVGWDDSYSRDNFNENCRPDSDGAWLAKNSWGSELSDAPDRNAFGITDENGRKTGYFWISYEDRSLTDAVSFYYDITPDENDLTEQYNYLNAPATMKLTGSRKTPAANIFTMDGTSDLTAVSCETLSGGASVTYEIYRLNSGYSGPTDGTLITSLNRTYPYAGFHRETIDAGANGQLKKGDAVSIVVSIRAGDGSSEIPLPYGWTQAFADRHNANYPASRLTGYYNGVINPGESFVSDGSSWTDLTSVIGSVSSADSGYYTFDNLPLRIYVRQSEESAGSDPTAEPSVTPTAEPSATPTPESSAAPTPESSATPTAAPSVTASTASYGPAASEQAAADRYTAVSVSAAPATVSGSAASGAETGDANRPAALAVLFAAAAASALILIRARRKRKN